MPRFFHQDLSVGGRRDADPMARCFKPVVVPSSVMTTVPLERNEMLPQGTVVVLLPSVS